MDNIREKVTSILTSKLGFAQSEITPEAKFMKDLGIDSLDYVELIMEFEQAFNIRIPDEDASNLQTVGQAIDYISHKVLESRSAQE